MQKQVKSRLASSPVFTLKECSRVCGGVTLLRRVMVIRKTKTQLVISPLRSEKSKPCVKFYAANY